MDDAPEIGRGVMLVCEIAGEPVARRRRDRPRRRSCARRDATWRRINALAVEGFGWIRRDEPVWPPRAVDATYEAFVDGGAAVARGPRRPVAAPARRAVRSKRGSAKRGPTTRPAGWRTATSTRPTSSRATAGYTGVIDLGEMRGAEPHYDLAYFLVQDRGGCDARGSDRRLCGGDAVRPDDLTERMRRSATVIVRRSSADGSTRDGIESLERPSGRWWLAGSARSWTTRT